MSIKSVLFFALAGYVHFCFGTLTASFEGGLPSGWEKDSRWTTNYTYSGVVYLRTNIGGADEETHGYAKLTNGVDRPICDNVVAEVVLQNKKPVNAKIDSFRVVVSTNNWATEAIYVGDAFKYYDSSSPINSWITHKVLAPISGLRNCDKFYYGLEVITEGNSFNDIFIKSLTLDFLAGATCTGICFDNGSGPQIGAECAVVVATINTEPADKITELSVWAEVERNGLTYTNQMFASGNGTYTNDVLKVDSLNVGSKTMPPIDAGDQIRVHVFTKYASSIRAIGSFDEITGLYIEKSDKVIEYIAPKLGSVWINEFSFDQVEICGTTNRQYLSGWALELVDTNTQDVVKRKDFNDIFDFNPPNMPNKMIGLLTYNLGWTLESHNKTYSLRLINAAGIIEHLIPVVTIEDTAKSLGMTGIAPWPSEGFAYDWAGTATNGTFSGWEEMISSFGSVNNGQFFSIRNSGFFQAKTVIPSKSGSDEALPCANVSFEIEFSAGTTNGILQTNGEGVTPTVEFSGAHTNEMFVSAEFAVSAFGWTAEPQCQTLSFGASTNEVKIELSPTVAIDDFSTGKIESYWNNYGTKKFVYGEQSGNGFARFNSSGVAPGEGIAELRTGNPIMTRGKARTAISFSVRNDLKNKNANYNYATVVVASNKNFTTESIVANSIAISNKVRTVSTDLWNSGITSLRLPDFVDESTPLYVAVRGDTVGTGASYVTLDVDNIRIAFQDVAMPTNLVRSVEDVASGDDVDFTLDVVPQTSDFVSNVTAMLNFTLNGATTNVPFAFAGATSTNLDGDATAGIKAADLKAVMGDLTGIAGGRPFLTGDTVSYYATVNYFADNADTDESKQYENRYFPDNHKTVMVGDVEHWVVEGTGTDPYTYVATNFTVTGDALMVVTNGLATTADGVSMFVHGYNEDGVSNLTVTISNRTTDAVMTYQPFGNTNALERVSGWFNLNTGLDASTDYSVFVTAVDASGNAIEASKEVVFTTKPMIPVPVITGVSSTTAKLTVSGAAAGYIVEPAGWGEGTQVDVHNWYWTRSGGTPNGEFTATVTATNKLGEASEPVTTNGYTLAAVATKVPVVEKDASKTKVVVRAADDETLNGNPAGTKYAVAISNGTTAVIATTNGVEVWKTLGDWKGAANAVTFSEHLDLPETNYFFFVTRNDAAEWNWAQSSGPVTNCTFDMSAQVVGHGQMLTPDFGLVAVTNVFFDPAQSNSLATLQYKIGEGEWLELTNDVEVVFDELVVSNSFTWNAWKAVGEANGSYAYSIRAKIANKGSTRVSEWSDVVSGSLDFVKPTVTLGSTTPETFGPVASPMKVSVTFDKEVAGFSDAAISVANGTIGNLSGSGSSYTFEVTPAAEGAVSVQVLADKVNDKFGNKNAASTTLTRTYHATPPTWNDPAIDGEPAEGVVTNGTDFAFKASASDPVGPVTYEWQTNGVVVTGQTSAKYEASGCEGTNTVTVIAIDGASNRSVATNRTWVIDTIAPTLPIAIVCEPASNTIVKVTGYKFTVQSEDATARTYHWLLNGVDVDSTAATISGTAREEGNSVSVFATDEAGNVSPTNAWSWTVDTLVPSNLAFTAESTPAANQVISSKSFNFTVSALDQTTITYFWKLNNGDWAEGTANYTGDAAPEGTNTVSVYAKDAAGNACDPISRTWVVDTTAPTKPAVTGIPANGALTNSTEVALTASSEDATKIAYHWTFNGTPVDGTDALLSTNTASGATVRNAAEVYATDEAGNVSETNYWNWAVDTVSPSVTNMTSTTSDPFGQGTEFLEVKVMFSEPVVGFVKESVTVDNNATVDSVESVAGSDDATYVVKINPVDDGKISVQIQANATKDRAGNGNLASAVLSRTYDTKPPENLTLAGIPLSTNYLEKVVVTNGAEFAFTASAVDTTKLTYHWVLNGVERAETISNYVGTAVEGTNTLSVYAKDALGNDCPAITNLWVVDTYAPTNLVVSGYPANGSITNLTSYRLTATAMDSTILTYHWTLDGGAEVLKGAGEAFESAGPLADGSHKVTCQAVDEAGLKSDVTNWTWTVDTVHPTVTLSTDVPATFNKFKVPYIVTATFSEKVDNFTASSVTITPAANGTVTNVTQSGNVYTIYIDPREETEEETFVPFTVQIAEDAVRDPAGNGNEASVVLSHRNVTKLPTVTLASTNSDSFNAAHSPLVVTATFVRGKKAEAAIVTNFTQEILAPYVTNGTLVSVTPLPTDETYPTNIYTMTIAPINEGLITVAIPAGIVKDSALNPNEPGLKTWTYDNTPPTVPVLSGIPVSVDLEHLVATNGKAFNLTATATDAVSSVAKYHWKLNDQPWDQTLAQYTGEAPEGTNTVVVYAEDAAGNVGGAITNKWVVDLTKPQWADPAITGVPEKGVETQATGYDLTAHATDKWTAITYHWELAMGGALVKSGSDANFSDSGLADGKYVASAWVTDEAGNVSTTNTWDWTVDTTPPADLKISGEFVQKPGEAPVITSKTGFSFSASATDASQTIEYFWMTNNVLIADATNKLEGVAIEGSNWVVVVAKDAAGNTCAPVTNLWIVDTISPVISAIAGETPEKDCETNSPAYKLSASSTDVNPATNFWVLLKGDATVASLNLPATNGVETVFKGEVNAGEGAYTAKFWSVDAAGNASTATNTWFWTYDVTPPGDPEFAESCSPSSNSVTSVSNYNLTASSTDANAYYWTLTRDGTSIRTGTGANFAGDVAADGVYTAMVYTVDKAGNVSLTTNSWAWIFDKTAPIVGDIKEDGTPEYSCETNSPAYKLSASSTDVNPATNFWVLVKDDATVASLNLPATNDVETVFKGEVNAGEGVYTAKFWSVDAAGNASTATNTWFWMYDTTPPGDPQFDEGACSPASNSVTSVSNYNLTASSTDANVYYWTLTLNGTSIKTATGATFAGDVAADGVYTAMVYTVDKAGNISQTTNSWAWIFDKTAPVISAITGETPEKDCETNSPAYKLSASSTDVNPATNFWALVKDDATVASLNLPATNGVATAFEGTVTDEGVYTAKFWSVDAAGNASATTNEWSWTYDVTPPGDPQFDEGKCSPASNSVTSVSNYTLTASSTDANAYYWTLTLDGTSIRTGTGANFAGDVAADGVYTAMVYTVDKAGNVSQTTNSWAWIFDTTPPDVSAIVGVTPEYDCETNSPAYELSASSDDTNPGTNFWTLVKDGAVVASLNLPATNGVATVFKGAVNAGDGVYTAMVWSVDAAGNASTATNEWSWTYDVTPPGDPQFDGGKCSPASNSVTSVSNYTLTASSTDANAYYWTLTLDGTSIRTGTGATFKGDVSVEGVYTAMVYTVDKAGNVSQTTNSWAWIFDTTPPDVSDIVGVTPEYDCETNSPAYELSASSADTNPGTNFWALVKGGAVVASLNLPATNGVATVFKGAVNAGDGVYTAMVWSVDAAGNASTATNRWVWTYDTVPNATPDFDESASTPTDLSVTNGTGYALSAASSDAKSGTTYHWALVTNNFQIVRGWEVLSGKFEGDVAAEGVYTALVYSVDRAGNISETNEWSWIYDKTAPTLSEITGTPRNGCATNVTHYALSASSRDVNPSTNFWMLLKGDAVIAQRAQEAVNDVATTFEGDVTAEGAYTAKFWSVDAAGNVSATNAWNWSYDVTQPTVTLKARGTPDPFTDLYEFSVTVAFSEPIVNLTAESIEVNNGVVEDDPVPTGVANTYTFTVLPVRDGDVTVQLPAGAVKDLAGNGNVASGVVQRMYDNTEPMKPTISGTPAKTFKLTVTSWDENGIDHYVWFVNGETNITYVNELSVTSRDGLNKVKVYAVDYAFNLSEDSDAFAWTYANGVALACVDFGGGVTIVKSANAPTKFSFVSVDFQQEAKSTFVLEGFESPTPTVTDLNMQFVFKNLGDGTSFTRTADKEASYDMSTKLLTVTLPASDEQSTCPAAFITGITSGD